MAYSKALFVSAAILTGGSAELANQTVSDDPCLCIFDFDRTLTAKQGDRKCPGVEVIDPIHDDAYGGGPLTLSALAKGLDQTFCKKCYLGVISHGDAGGPNSQMRQRLLVMLNMNKDQALRVPDLWSGTPNSKGDVTAPLVLKVDDSAKHRVAHGIRTWYGKNRGKSFTAAQTWFFDDRTDNVKEFEGAGYNAIQVSCNSRDHTGKHTGEIGYCGGVTSEARQELKGMHLCHSEVGDNATVVV